MGRSGYDFSSQQKICNYLGVGFLFCRWKCCDLHPGLCGGLVGLNIRMHTGRPYLSSQSGTAEFKILLLLYNAIAMDVSGPPFPVRQNKLTLEIKVSLINFNF